MPTKYRKKSFAIRIISLLLLWVCFAKKKAIPKIGPNKISIIAQTICRYTVHCSGFVLVLHILWYMYLWHCCIMCICDMCSMKDRKEVPKSSGGYEVQ